MTASKENIFLLNTHKISMNGRYYFNGDDDDDERFIFALHS